jgi:uncharacterized protein YdeI (BOF family)
MDTFPIKECEMKKVILASLLVMMSAGVSAEEGGYKAGDTPPPQHKQDAGYKGSEVPVRRILIRSAISVRADM